MRLSTALLFAAGSALTLAPSTASAQVSLTTSTYSQNFNTLPSTLTASANGGNLNNINTALNGWYFLETGTNANTTITAGTGSANTGDTYSFGATSSTDRSLGSLQSTNVVPSFGFYFTNNTGSTITSISLSYLGEVWRIGAISRADRLDFSYSTNATSLSNGLWTNVDALDFSSTSAAATANGSLLQSATISSSISSLSLANGSSFFVRWTSFDATGADDGMAIDDFSLTATLQALATGNYWSPGASGGGAGTWSSPSATWSETAGTQGTASQATTGALLFAGTAGTVTVSGAVTAAAGLTFSTDGYTLSGGTGITLSGADASTNTLTVDSAVGATISTAITATNGLTKAGTGTLTLGGSNTLGAVTVSAGGLVLGNASALGNTASGTTVSSGATLDLNGQTIGAEAIALAGSLANGSGTAASLAGLVTVSGSAGISTTGNLTLSGGTAGAGSIAKSGNGTLTLTGATGHSGGTTVSAGTLATSGAGTLTGNVTLASGTTLTLAGATTLGTLSTGNATLNLTFGSALTTTTLNLDGVLDLSLLSLGAAPVAGTYNLLTFSSLTGLGSINFTPSLAGYSLVGTLNADSYSLAITLLAKSLSWGGGNATWSVEGGNWTNDSTSAAATFENGDQVTFGSGISGGTVTVSEGVTFGAITVNTENINLTFAGAGLAGAGNIALNGTGTIVTLNNANTFTGAVQVNAGKLLATNNAALGSTEGSTTVASGAELSLEGGVTVTNEALSLAGTLSSGAGANTFTGAITLTNNATLSAVADTSLTVSGAITGSTRALSVAGDGSTILSGGLTAASLTKSDAGTLTLSAASTLTSGATLNAGTLNLNHATALGNGTLTINGGALGNTSGSAKTVANALTVAGDFALGTAASDGDLNLSGATNLGAASRTVSVTGSHALSGAITNGSLVKAGEGTLTLSGTNTLSGLSVNTGTLRMGSAGALGGSAITVEDGASLELNGQNATLTSLSGSGTVANGGSVNSTLTLDTALATTVVTSFTDGVGAGKLGLTKSGAGTLTLTAASTNTGAVAINAGSVIANAGGALGSGTVTMASGTTFSAGDETTQSNAIVVNAPVVLGVIENFNALAAGLPTGWTVRTGATATALGTTVTPVLTATEWGSTPFNFRNVASFGSNLSSTASTEDQAAATDRALGVRLTGASGDPGAAFVYQFSTVGQDLQGLSVDLQMLSVQGRSNTYSLQVAAGATPSSWTTLDTYTDPDEFGSTTFSYDAAALTSIANQADAWFRVVTLTSSSGSSSRDTVALDNFTLTYGGAYSDANPTIGVTNTNAAASFGGNISLLGSADLTAAAESLAIFSGDISGAGGLTKVGEGRVVLSGANTFSGGITISAGTLETASTGALGAGTVTVSGGTLDLGGLAVAGTIAVSGGTLLGAGGLDNTATLQVGADSILTFATVDDFGLANILLSGGTLDLNNLNPNNVITFVSGSFLNASEWNGTVAPTGTGDVTSQLDALGAIGGGVQLGAGQSANLAGLGLNIVFNGATVSGLSTFTGNLTIAGGTLNLTGGQTLGDGGTVTLSTGGTINFGSNESTQAITYAGGTINGTSYFGTVTIAAGGPVTIDGATFVPGASLRTAAGAALNLTGNVSNALSYSGGTITGLANLTGFLTVVTGHNLTENGTIGGSVVLQDGATLSGDTIIAGNLGQVTGSTLAPGNSPGILQVQGNLTPDGGAMFEMEIQSLLAADLIAAAGTAYDTIQVGGLLDLSGISSFTPYIIRLVSINGASANVTTEGLVDDEGFTLQLFSYDTLELGGQTLSDLFQIQTDALGKSFFAQDGVTALSADRFALSIGDNNTSILLTYTAIPEPSTYGLILGGLALAGAAIRRRKQKAAK